VGKVGAGRIRDLRVPCSPRRDDHSAGARPASPQRAKEGSSEILLRVFCHAHGKKVVLLLAGYDKGKEPSSKRQNTEIKRAKQRPTRWKAEQDRLAKQARPIGGVRKRRGKWKS